MPRERKWLNVFDEHADVTPRQREYVIARATQTVDNEGFGVIFTESCQPMSLWRSFGAASVICGTLFIFMALFGQWLPGMVICVIAIPLGTFYASSTFRISHGFFGLGTRGTFAAPCWTSATTSFAGVAGID